jgi:anti-sigma factor RsiW
MPRPESPSSIPGQSHNPPRDPIDDTVLLAYVDGNLPAEQNAAVAAAIAHSAELAERVAAMRGRRVRFTR